MGCELFEAQRRRFCREAGVFEQAPRLQTVPLQGLEVLVGEEHGVVLGAHPLRAKPVVVNGSRNPSSWIHTGARQKQGVGGMHAAVYK